MKRPIGNPDRFAISPAVAISSSSLVAAAPESTASRAKPSPSRRSRACPAAAIAPAAFRRIAERRPPFSPANTALIAAAFSAGEPPRSSAGSQRSTPSSTGSISRSWTSPSTTSQTRFGPAGESSSIPPAPWTTNARRAPRRASTSAIVRTSVGA